MVRRITSKPRQGGYHVNRTPLRNRAPSRIPIVDDSNRIDPGVGETQFRAAETYILERIYGGRVHPPPYDRE